MRIHLLSVPNGQTTREYSLCGFLALTIRFARMMKNRGHTVFLYASEENEAPCDELITVITKPEQRALLGDIPYQSVWFDPKGTRLWQVAFGRTIAGIEKRMQRGDFICSIGGSADKPIFDHFEKDCFGVEYSIGYQGTHSKYRVFESHWHRSFIQGFYQNQAGNFFDEVIPVPFEPSEFWYEKKPGDYFVYLGRLTQAKGVHIACEVAEKAGVKLKVIGHGETDLVGRGAEYLGALPADERNEVLSKARACFCPTTYMEPFNCVAVEAQLFGVPVISTPWGGFTETVEQGVSGFRCAMFRDFLKAVKDVDNLDRLAIRTRAMGLYTPTVIGPQYDAYFSRVSEMHGAGWYAT